MVLSIFKSLHYNIVWLEVTLPVAASTSTGSRIMIRVLHEHFVDGEIEPTAKTKH